MDVINMLPAVHESGRIEVARMVVRLGVHWRNLAVPYSYSAGDFACTLISETAFVESFTSQEARPPSLASGPASYAERFPWRFAVARVVLLCSLAIQPTACRARLVRRLPLARRFTPLGGSLRHPWTVAPCACRSRFRGSSASCVGRQLRRAVE